MKWVQCDGRNPYNVFHQYDPLKYPSGCPECGVPGVNLKTVSVGPPKPASGVGSTVPVDPNGSDGKAKNAPAEDEPKVTIVYSGGKEGDRSKQAVNPVVGWLVCVAGVQLGQDYQIRTGNNSIGRDPRMDITVKGDQGISAAKAGFVSYDPKKRSFTAINGEGHTIMYVNEEQVTTAQQLNPYDIIELGETKLLFLPLCGERFAW